MKKLFFSLVLIVNLTSFQLFNQELASCDCTIDTIGYADFVSTLNIQDVPINFHTHNQFAVAIGYITSSTPNTVQSLIDNYPDITTIVFLDSGGSEDDEANLEASMKLYSRGYKMYVPSNGMIASGAVDMFLAGRTRVVDQGAKIGVHSWSDGFNDATYYPEGHSYHQPYIDYYQNVGFTQEQSEDFYYYTIHAAPANSIHWMSNTHISNYYVRTCTYASSPNYSISINEDILYTSPFYPNYQWIQEVDGNWEELIGETSDSYSVVENGVYAVIIHELGCGDTSETVNFNSVSVFDYKPLNYELKGNKILLNDNVHNAQMVVFNLNGQIISKSTITESYDFSDLPIGIYVIQLIINDQITMVKISKQ